MPLFGSPWVQLHGAQIHLAGRWADWPARGVRLLSDIWHEGKNRWRTAGECWDGGPTTPVVEAGLRTLQSAIPPDWHELLRAGRTAPGLGEWVVIRANGHHHQDATMSPELQIGCVTGGGWVGTQQHLWMELYSYSELRRGFVQVEGASEEKVEWSPTDWRVARAEFSPDEAGGHGLFYGPTHDVYSWMPRRVQWLDAVTGRLICDLETFSVQAGRRILSPGLNTMTPAAMTMHSRLSDAETPSLTQAFDRVWQGNTWLPVVREYAWRVLTGTAFTAASMLGRPHVERWQCSCTFCIEDDVLDTWDHRLTTCTLARHAWMWTQQVLGAASLPYTGTAANFWLYGGSPAIHDERVVTTLRGAFFEALPATQRRLTGRDVAVRAETLSEMLRARTLTEMQRDIFYVSADYERSYDARDKKMGRPEDEDDVLTEWRGFVQQAGMADAGLVGTLPQVGSGLSQSRRRNTIACVLGDPLVLCVRAKVDTEHYRE